MSRDTDITCYIIGYIPVRPEIWSGAGSLPLCWAPALLLPSVVRYQALPGTVCCFPFLSELRRGRPYPPPRARCCPRIRKNRVGIHLLNQWKCESRGAHTILRLRTVPAPTRQVRLVDLRRRCRA